MQSTNETMTLDKGGGGHGFGGGGRGFGGGGRRGFIGGGGHRSSGGRRSGNFVSRRAPRVGSLRGTRSFRRGSTRGYGRNYRHVGYRRGFWGRGGSFYPFGFGAYWFGLYPWLPYYYGLYAYNYYPSLWTPIYVPITTVVYTDVPRAMTDESSYMLNPDLPPNTEVPTQPLPALNIDINVLRSIGNKRREDLNPMEEARIKQVFDAINLQYSELVQRMRQEGTYDYWISRGYRIVPDLDRGRFIWIRDDSTSQTNRISSDIILNHYYKELEGQHLLYEEGYLVTKLGDIYEYSVEHSEASSHHPTLEEKMGSAMYIGSLPHTETLDQLHEKLASHTDIHHQKQEKPLLQHNECEFLVGYHMNALPRIIYGSHGDKHYHNESDIAELYHSLEWHEEVPL